MDQTLALEIMGAGEHVFLTGPAGSGKTFVLNEFIRRAKSDGKHVAVTATTGLAASHLGGATIHAWSGMGIHDELPNKFFDHLPKGRREIIEKTDVLIIDEISMLHDFRLDVINAIAKTVRRSDKPFGGIQIILCGDFFQLPPVNRGDSRTGGFVVHAEAWQELTPVICYLEEQHRQNDADFLSILNALRAGDIRRHHAEALLGRQDATLGDDQEITELHTVNIDVDRINNTKLQQLSGDEVVYGMETTGSENYVATLKRSCLAPEELRLRKGALVMCIKNSLERKYVNGSIGKVIDFEASTHYPIVELRNGKVITLQPDTWELRDGTKKRASLSQIPLRLAWAITVHKSQGMTLDAARIDLRRAFVEGMGYVALSRVRELAALSLSGINRMALRVSGDALAIDQGLREKAASDAKKFEHLRAQAAKRTEIKPNKSAAANSWAAKIEKMRQTYPNAYRPWKDTDDAVLKEKFQQGEQVASLSKLLGRHENSITMRLQKHLGEDAVPTPPGVHA